MGAVIGPLILGAVITVLGICNMKGNISSIHWYHRQRVSEEDRLPFGRLVGLGTVIIGACVMLFGCLSYVSSATHNQVYTLIGSGITVIGVIAGIGLSFYAMFKYNKGIF